MTNDVTAEDMMEGLLQAFETPFTDANGDIYDVHLHGHDRPGDTWQAWIVFTRRSDGLSFATDVETTQPSQAAVLYWATGLTGTYFEGAFERARRARTDRSPVERVPAPLRDGSSPAAYAARLDDLEREILGFFGRHGSPQLATRALFDELPHAHADVVRALEDLEKQRRYLVRRTEQGTDWVILTEEGLRASGLGAIPHSHDTVVPEPPKNVR